LCRAIEKCWHRRFHWLVAEAGGWPPVDTVAAYRQFRISMSGILRRVCLRT
jgi:hypothetical protein